MPTERGRIRVLGSQSVRVGPNGWDKGPGADPLTICARQIGAGKPRQRQDIETRPGSGPEQMRRMIQRAGALGCRRAELMGGYVSGSV